MVSLAFFLILVFCIFLFIIRKDYRLTFLFDSSILFVPELFKFGFDFFNRFALMNASDLVSEYSVKLVEVEP